ncbi:MAG: HNH endonuclease [Candidatus Thorarchaeota archaeon]|jgi:hypothetical protein
MAYKRNYKKEYKKFQSSSEQKKKRAQRNKRRRQALKNGRVKKGDGFDLAEIKTKLGNIVIRKKKKSQNRGSKTDMPGDKKARGKGQKKNQPKRKKK